MESEQKSAVWWFKVGLISSLVVCLCLATGFVTIAYGNRAVQWAKRVLSAAEPIEGTSTASIGEGTSTPDDQISPSLTVQAIPTASSESLDRAAQTQRMLSSTIVPVNDPISLAERFKGISGIPRVLAESAEPIPLGSVESFWANDSDTDTYFEVEAELAYATDHIYFWIEIGVDYDPDDLSALVEKFETQIYPVNRNFFGSEWTPGVDGDPHLYVLYTRGLGSYVAGYYSPSDEISPLASEYSNGHEMFYLNADNSFLWKEYTYGVLAHEFQHMIHWYQDSNEDNWLNEGFSELAVYLNDYDVGGFDYVFASEPDQTLTYWSSETGTNGPRYGQTFLFVTYFLDRFGSEVTQAVAANPANGFDSIDQTLASLGLVDEQSGGPLTVDRVYADWATALWLQDPSVGDGHYAYQSYSPPWPSTADRHFDCPVDMQNRQVSQYGLDYIEFSCKGDFSLIFDGVSEVPVVAADPHSGDFSFWSNRSDTSDMTLTRSFDFSDVVGSISFDYWVWYDIEEDWDYLYLEASMDGGETWEFIKTPSGTDTNPTGNSYGWGYTGYSGGSSGPIWIEESVDLSHLAGNEVLLRFEYITDAAVNGEGFLLDDLSIEAIGYSEDFEGGDGDWQAEGFVHLYNRLPQTYRLMLVERGTETRVRQIQVDGVGHAEVQLNLGQEYDEAILIVIGTTRHTWQPADYLYQVVP